MSQTVTTCVVLNRCNDNDKKKKRFLKIGSRKSQRFADFYAVLSFNRAMLTPE